MGNVAFEALDDPPRLRVADTVGNEQYTLFLDSPVDPESVPADGFAYPVSDAVRVELEGFELEGIVKMHLWNRDGELLHAIEHGDELGVRSDDYYLELCRSVKTYLRFSGSVDVTSSEGSAKVGFGEPTVLEIGARSQREQPAYTITTTDDPEAMMQALSCLGEGLLTTTPSRSFPNLRGYPPAIQNGDELRIPDSSDTGEQPVTIILPPELDYLYEAAPLIYYLNARVAPGSNPTVLVEGEEVFELEADSFASSVENLLRHVFTLDCAVRTVGSYPVSTLECEHLREVIPYDLDDLYQAEESSRLPRYLEIPFEPVAEQAPGFPAIGYVEPRAENIEAVPHLVAQLVPIRTATPRRISGERARREALAAFTTGSKSTRAASDVFNGDASFVNVGGDSPDVTIWAGSDIPISSNKLLVKGFQNRFERIEDEGNSIDVTIVCNESWMSEEATIVADHYTERDDLPFSVTTHEHLDRAAFAAVLAEGTDFLHYVGHATTEGLKCSDGYLDVASVSSIGTETFFLNACQSYQQATRLVDGGAIGGIATLSDVTDDQATIVGRTVAKLLDSGFPLRVALEIARSRSVIGGQYLVVGDGAVTLVASDGPPNKCIITETDDGYTVENHTFQSLRAGPGAVFVPGIESENDGYLVGSSPGPFELSRTELLEFLKLMNVPVEYHGEFRWAFDLAAELD